MKYTIKWESNGNKLPIKWEKYEHRFPRFSPYDEFCCIFLYYRKLIGKPMHFPYDAVYRRMKIVWGKNHPCYGKEIPWFTQYEGFCCIFPYYEKLMGKPMNFPYDVYHRMGI